MLRANPQNQRATWLHTLCLDRNRDGIAIVQFNRHPIAACGADLDIDEIHRRRADKPGHKAIDRMMIKFQW